MKKLIKSFSLICAIFFFGVIFIQNVNAEENEKTCGQVMGGGFKLTYQTGTGDTIDNSSRTVIAGASCSGMSTPEELPTPTKEGYTFNGWYYDEALTNKVNGSTTCDVQYTKKDNSTPVSEGCFNDVVLYAAWEKNEKTCGQVTGGGFKLTYQTGTGDAIDNSSTKVVAGASCSGMPTQKELPTPTKEGYTFNGWYYDEALTNKVNGSTTCDVQYTRKDNSTPVSEGCFNDVVLYASWEKNEKTCGQVTGGGFTLTYQTGTGDAIDNSSTKVVAGASCSGMSTQKELPTPTKEGYTFKGWYYDKALTNKVNGSTTCDVQYTKKDNSTPVSEGCFNDVVLYAAWEKNITNTDNKDVTILSKGNSLENVAKIEINKIEKVDYDEIIISEKFSNYVVYDINLYDEHDQKVQPNGKITLRFLIPKNMNKSSLAVYRVDKEELIEYKVTVDGDYALIETDHFSEYILGDKKVLSNPNTGDNILIYLSFCLVLICGLIVTSKKICSIK